MTSIIGKICTADCTKFACGVQVQRLQVGWWSPKVLLFKCDHTKVITQVVYYTNKKNFDSLNQPATYIIYIDTLKLFSFIIMYTEMQIFIRMSHSKIFLNVGNYA